MTFHLKIQQRLRREPPLVWATKPTHEWWLVSKVENFLSTMSLSVSVTAAIIKSPSDGYKPERLESFSFWFFVNEVRIRIKLKVSQ